MRRSVRWGPLALSLAVLLALGLFGLWLVRGSTAAAETALGEGAVRQQRTVSALTEQYLLIAAKEILEFGSAAPLELAPESAGDAALLQEFVDDRSEFFDHGAVLSDLAGRRLTVVGDVPPADDPGYQPLRSSLMRRQPGVSSVMHVDDQPVVAVGVPVLRDGEPAAVIVAFFRTDLSNLQHYSAKLGAGSQSLGMVVDGDGTIVAARRQELVGRPLWDSPAHPRVRQADAGHAEFVHDGVDTVASWSTIPTGGWTIVGEESAATFFASAREQSQSAQLAILGLFLAAGVSAALLNDRTDRTRRRGEARCEALVRDANDVITIIDDSGAIRYASAAMPRVLGYDQTEVVGRRAVDLVHPDDAVKVRAAVLATAGAPECRQRIQVRIARADGTFCPCEVIVSDQHADPSVRGTIISFRDMTELVALHERLSHQALHDPLTELPNRTQLEQRMRDSLAACEDDRRVAALFIDLDGFKAVNDQLGHERGDELLIEVAARLQRCVRERDLVARLGGDEFVIVLAGPEPEENATRIATRALELLSEPFRVGQNVVTIGGSIGIAVGGRGSEPETVLREADAAMYLAKERGRLRFEFPSAGITGTSPSAAADVLAGAGDHPLVTTV